MARIVFGTLTETAQPAWAGDFFNREHLLPGGSKVLASAFTADANGVRYIPSGTLVGRTFTERDAGTAFGPAADADEEIYILAHDVVDAAINNDCTLYRHEGLVKVNHLPGWGGLSTALKAYVNEHYQTTRGAN